MRERGDRKGKGEYNNKDANGESNSEGNRGKKKRVERENIKEQEVGTGVMKDYKKCRWRKIYNTERAQMRQRQKAIRKVKLCDI